MLTMPLAGKLTDKYGPGWFVLGGLGLIVAGMSVFTQVTDTTAMPLLLGALFVMGMGMGATMMPIMTAALSALSHHEVARGSTLMNIVQQSAGSIGTAVMSVILTNQLLTKPAVVAVRAAQGNQSLTDKLTPDLLAQVPPQMAAAFAVTFTVALALIVLCFVPALGLSRRAPVHESQEAASAPVAMH